MKDILDIYESLLDRTVNKDNKSNTVILHSNTPTVINDYFKTHMTELYSTTIKAHPEFTYSNRGWGMKEDGTIYLKYGRTGDDAILITDDLPNFIKFNELGAETEFIFRGPYITKLNGLPDASPLATVEIIDCPNLNDFSGAPISCDYLLVKNCSGLKSLKGLPHAKNIRFVNSGEWTVDQIAKFSKTKKSNIVVLK